MNILRVLQKQLNCRKKIKKGGIWKKYLPGRNKMIYFLTFFFLRQ